MRARYAFVALVVLSFALAGSSMLFSVHYVHATQAAAAAQQQREQASQQRQAAAEQAAQQHAGAAIETKLCRSLEPLVGLARLKPPAGNPADNPSRAFEQQLVAKLAPLAQLGPDLGCQVKP